jgi:hypothetical protein
LCFLQRQVRSPCKFSCHNIPSLDGSTAVTQNTHTHCAVFSYRLSGSTFITVNAVRLTYSVEQSYS